MATNGLLEALGLKPQPTRTPPARGTTTRDDSGIGLKSTQDLPEMPRRDPELKVAARVRLVHGQYGDLLDALAPSISHRSNATLRFEPQLATLALGATRRVLVSLPPTAMFAAAGPQPIEITLEKADPELKAADPPPLFVGDDVETALRKAISFKGTGVPAFDKSFAELGQRGEHRVVVSLTEGGTHRAVPAGQGPTIVVKVLRRTPVIKSTGALPDRFENVEKSTLRTWQETLLADLKARLDADGSRGDLKCTPEIKTLKGNTGVQDLQVWLAETDTHEASNPLPVKVRVCLRIMDATVQFNTWWAKAYAELSQEKKNAFIALGIKSAGDFVKLPGAASCTSTKEVAELADRFVVGAPCGRLDIWRVLGYASLKSNATYVMERATEWELNAVKYKLHVTVSFGSIGKPPSGQQLTGTADNVYKTLFDAGEAKWRVHATAQWQGDNKAHYFFGGTDGDGESWAGKKLPPWKQKLIAKLKEEIEAWEPGMKTKVSQVLTQLQAMRF